MICGIAVSVSSCDKGEDDNKPKQEIVDHIRLDNYTKQQIDMAPTAKRRAVCSYENMSEELAAAFAEKYPKGYADYFPDLVKYDKPNGDSFYAVTVEITDAIYLVKINLFILNY